MDKEVGHYGPRSNQKACWLQSKKPDKVLLYNSSYK